MERDYEWTLDDVRDAMRRAELKRLEWNESRDTAFAMQCEYWTRQLVRRFPELEYKADCGYFATIAFSDGEKLCRVKGPKKYEYGGTRVLVWRKGSKGKWNKLASSYQCSEIIPFIKSVSLPKSGTKDGTT